MYSKFKAIKPETIDFELTLSMPLKDWKILQSDLGRNWPASQLSMAITDMVAQANAIYWPITPPHKD